MNKPNYIYRCTGCKGYRQRPICTSCGPAAVLVKIQPKETVK